MAIIYSYPKKTTPNAGDFLVITDSEQPAPNKNRTKSLTIGDLASFVVSSQSAITGGGTLNTIPLFTPNGSKIGDSIITQSSNASNVTITGNATVTSDLTCNNETYTDTLIVNDSADINGQLAVEDTATFNAIVEFTPGSANSVTINNGNVNAFSITAQSPSRIAGIIDNTGSVGTSGQVLSSTGSDVQWISDGGGTVTGNGTANFLTKWDAAGTGIEDSKIKYVPADDKMIVSLTSADFEFFTAGRFKTKFVECTQDTMSTFVGAIRTKSMEVGFTSGAGQAPLDVQPDSNGKAAVFRGGVIIAPSNISNIQVDNSSLIVGAGNNDIVSGSDHCLAVGNGNQIINNADNSFATGVRNVIDGTGAAQPVRSQVFGFENELKGSYSSFVAGGQNHVETGNNGMVLGFNNGTDANPIKGSDAVFAFGAGNSYTSATGQNVFMLGNSLTGSNGTLNIGFRNNTSQYPATDFSNGLGETKVVISAGTTTTSNSNAIIITEGGVFRAAGVSQVPRIILPTVTSFEYTNGTLAKAAGIPVGGLFHTAGVLKIVLSTD